MMYALFVKTARDICCIYPGTLSLWSSYCDSFEIASVKTTSMENESRVVPGKYKTLFET